MNNPPNTEALFIGDVAAALTENLTSVIYPPGTVIFREEEAPGHGYAYIIERGRVQITKRLGGRENVVAVLGAGELLGEMAPIDNQNRSATATALDETEVIPIGSEQLQRVIDTADPLVQLLLRALIGRLRSRRGETLSEPETCRLPDLESPHKSYESIRGRVIDQVKLGKSLRGALNRREFELYFQPIVSLSDYRIAGFEALIRWFSSEQGLVLPERFIPAAEELGIIVPIGLWILEHACHMLQRFQPAFKRAHPDQPPLFVSANVSARQLLHHSNVEDMIATINRTGVDPRCLKIEITEGLMLENPELAIAAFDRLTALGVGLALDDFGTGYSSLSYLHRFPLDTLKIDRSFVLSMLRNRESLTIVRTIATLARELKLQSVSEGIERPEELAKLQEIGCDYGQGYLFSKPVPTDDALELLSRPHLGDAVMNAPQSVPMEA